MNNNKILPLKALTEKIRTIRKGKKVALCHGVFDLFHVGHIKYLEQAKNFCDILVVTITPDKFVNKGPGRPVFNATQRADVLAALDVVDFVSVNNWPTAVETIKLLSPDYYVKGPDYSDNASDITGNIEREKNAVESVGGVIKYTDDITFSSSNLINRHLSRLNQKQQNYLKLLKSKYCYDEIGEMIEKMNRTDVLLVGEIIVDEYIFCDTIGKSGKEPVLVTQRLYSEKYAGGVLAVANHLSDFCRSVRIIAYIGDRDSHIDFIKSHISKNVEIDYVIKSNSPTILKTRFIDNYTKTKTLGVYDLNDKLLITEEENSMLRKIEKYLKNYQMVLVTDYGHGLITPQIVNMLENQSKYLAVNTQMNAFNVGYHTISKYDNANYICIHEGELRHDYRNRTDATEDLVIDLQKKIDSDNIVITMGKNGSMVYNDNNFTSCPAFTTDIVDRVGAGDALLAITSLAFYNGLPSDIAIFIGNLAAAQKIASIGNKQKLNKVTLLKSIESLLK